MFSTVAFGPDISCLNKGFDLSFPTIFNKSGVYGTFARVWCVSRERLPFLTPNSIIFLGLAYGPIVEIRFPELAVS